MSKNTDEPAFPTDNGMEGGLWRGSLGMTLRDYFAAKVMAAQIVAIGGLDNGNNNQALGLAVGSYAMADAMLEARE